MWGLLFLPLHFIFAQSCSFGTYLPIFKSNVVTTTSIKFFIVILYNNSCYITNSMSCYKFSLPLSIEFLQNFLHVQIANSLTHFSCFYLHLIIFKIFTSFLKILKQYLTLFSRQKLTNEFEKKKKWKRCLSIFAGHADVARSLIKQYSLQHKFIS